MKVRGRRRCADCGNRWSYYETGTPACPACGSLRSVGVEEERSLHTDAPTSLDLSEPLAMLDDRPVAEVAAAAAAAAREYLLARGFVSGGELLALDDTAVAAAELRHVAGTIERALGVDEPEERHLLDLLAGAESGTRPADVPPSLRAARGLAAVDIVSAYRRDLSAWLDERTDSDASRGDRRAVETLLTRLRDHEKRIAALEGDVPTAEADALVAAARGIGDYLRERDDEGEDDGEDEDSEEALDRVRERLDALG